MPRRRKRVNLTKRDIKNLKHISPSFLLILVGIGMGEIVIGMEAIIFLIGIVSIFFITDWLHNNFGFSSVLTSNLAIIAILILISLFIVISVALITRHLDEMGKKYRSIQIANIDSMSGIEFEQYLKRLLNNQGYSVRMTQASGDLGVDLIASCNYEIIAIQAKRQSNKVSRRAISDAVAGIHAYGCNKAMVITNNYFSPGAVTLAKSTGCILIDRDTLAKWVIEFQNIRAQNPII